MTLKELEDLFYSALVPMLGSYDLGDRMSYQTYGAPDFTTAGAEQLDYVFYYLSEKDDRYNNWTDARQEYDADRDTVLIKRFRTRVWEVLFTVYGPNACEIMNAIRDGFSRYDVNAPLKKENVHYIQSLPRPVRVNEHINGMWFQRWDLVLSFNELYEEPDEAAGVIEKIKIDAVANR